MEEGVVGHCIERRCNIKENKCVCECTSKKCLYEWM